MCSNEDRGEDDKRREMKKKKKESVESISIRIRFFNFMIVKWNLYINKKCQPIQKIKNFVSLKPFVEAEKNFKKVNKLLKR